MESTRWQDRILPAAAGASLGLGLSARAALLPPLGDDLSSLELIAAPPSILTSVLAAGAGGCLGIWALAWLARQSAPRVLHPLLLPGLAALALVPFATALVPPLAAVAGLVVDLVLLGCVAAALWRAAEHRGIRLGLTARQAGVLAFGLYLAVGWNLQREVGLSGDEPHYLIITQSLLLDGDLEIENNYDRGDWQEYYTGKIQPHLAQPGRGGARYSIHGVGLPILLLPGFALLGVFGVLLTEAFLGGLLVHEVVRATELLKGTRGGALLAACGFGATAPALFLSTSAYPELPAAVVTTAVYRRLLAPETPRGWRPAAYALTVGALPFLHAKFLPLAVVLGLALLLRSTGQRWRVVAGFAAGLAAVAVFFFWLFGDPNPAAAYGRPRVFLSNVARGLAGLLFDQEAGLLPASPFYFFALTALAGVCRSAPAAGLIAAAAFAAVALPGAAHPLWSGGSSPPARFLFPALPLLAVAAGAYWSQARRGVSRWAASLLLMSVLIGATMAFGPGQPLYLNQRDGSGRIWEILGRSWDLTHYLPSMVVADQRSRAMAAIGALLLVSASGLAVVNRSIRLPPLPIALLAVGTLIDWSFPGQAPAGSEARWTAELLRELAERDRTHFYSLPRGTVLAREALVGRLRLPLESPVRAAPAEEEAAAEEPQETAPAFSSAPFFIPSGKYRVRGRLSDDARLCNGEGCFATARTGEPFETGVGLRRFHVQARRAEAAYLEVLEVRPNFYVAERSQGVSSGPRLHSLDDNVFFESSGFWVRGRSTARLVLEAQAGSRLGFSFRNAGEENWVELQHSMGRIRFRLRAWEGKRVEVAAESGLQLVTIGSTAVFRAPPNPDAAVDRRPLGVFVTASGF